MSVVFTRYDSFFHRNEWAAELRKGNEWNEPYRKVFEHEISTACPTAIMSVMSTVSTKKKTKHELSIRDSGRHALARVNYICVACQPVVENLVIVLVTPFETPEREGNHILGSFTGGWRDMCDFLVCFLCCIVFAVAHPNIMINLLALLNCYYFAVSVGFVFWR